MTEFFLKFSSLFAGAVLLGTFVDSKLAAIDNSIGTKRATLAATLRAAENEIFKKFLLSENSVTSYLIRSVQVSLIFSLSVIVLQSIFYSETPDEISALLYKFMDFPLLFVLLLVGNCLIDSLSYYQTSVVVSFMTAKQKFEEAVPKQRVLLLHRFKCFILAFCDLVASVKIFTLTMPLVVILALLPAVSSLNSEADNFEVAVTSSEMIDYTGRSATAASSIRLFDGTWHTFHITVAALPSGIGRDFVKGILLNGHDAELLRTEFSTPSRDELLESFPNIGSEFVPTEQVTDYFSVAQMQIERTPWQIYQTSFFQYDFLENLFLKVLWKEFIFIDVRYFLGYGDGMSAPRRGLCIYESTDHEECSSVILIQEDSPSEELVGLQYAVDFMSADVPYSSFFISSILASILFYTSVIGLWVRRAALIKVPVLGSVMSRPITSLLVVLSFFLAIA
ncbi:hypothetical protein [Ruegeria sp. HKCCA6707]|uniref:hypothetical protein n=1 Tax=Ruegeria sp. HKCCA6707 TaxID=2682996 RepID=UPI00148770F8|nr:hypothetical protein [Ruegeria sp. HKCCA6707]